MRKGRVMRIRPSNFTNVDLECDTLTKTREKQDIKLRSNWLLSEIMDSAMTDVPYQEVISAINKGLKQTEIEGKVAEEYKKVYDHLSVLDADTHATVLLYDTTRIVVPINAVNKVLTALHIPHLGVTNTTLAAKTHFWWSTMSPDIKRLTESCPACNQYSINKKEPHLDYPTALADLQPTEHVHMDFADFDGNKFLILVDRVSGYLWIQKMNSTTAEAVITKLKDIFYHHGFPIQLSHDAGPPFQSDMYRTFCKSLNIDLYVTSAGHASANGRVERAVQSAKKMLKKCLETRQCWKLSLMYWNLCPRTTGASPAEILHRRRIRSHLPDLRNDITKEELDDTINKREEVEVERHARTQDRPDLPLLQKGDYAMVWDERTKGYNRRMRIIDRKVNNRSYILQDEDTDRIYARNRIHLRPDVTTGTKVDPIVICPVSTEAPKIKSILKTKYKMKQPKISESTVSFDTSWLEASKEWKADSERWPHWTHKI